MPYRQLQQEGRRAGRPNRLSQRPSRRCLAAPWLQRRMSANKLDKNIQTLSGFGIRVILVCCFSRFLVLFFLSLSLSLSGWLPFSWLACVVFSRISGPRILAECQKLDKLKLEAAEKIVSSCSPPGLKLTSVLASPAPGLSSGHPACQLHPQLRQSPLHLPEIQRSPATAPKAPTPTVAPLRPPAEVVEDLCHAGVGAGSGGGGSGLTFCLLRRSA